MSNENRELRQEGTLFWMWGLSIFVLSILLLTILSYAGIFGATVVEREVFENSFQYSEARKAEIATYEAQLAEINSQLSAKADPAVRGALEAQRAAINVRLHSAKTRK